MQNLPKQYNPIYSLLNSLRSLVFINQPAAGWLKNAPKEKAKPRPAMSGILSPDCVHLRAGAKKDPLRKNPAP